jgi:glycosyltransferase involved in cell wall biosynthesis
MVLMPYEPLKDAVRHKVEAEFDLREVFAFDRSSSRGFGARLKRELDPYCADTQGYGLGPEATARFERLVTEYDLVWFHGIGIPNLLQRKSWPCSVLDIDDVQSQVHAARASQAPRLLKRLKARREAFAWWRRERVLLNRFDIICTCSEGDKRYLGGGERIHVVPNGFEAPAAAPVRNPANPPRIGFIGTLRYAPNVDGLRWFIRSVWPLVKARRPDARLRLVGMETDSGIAGEGPDIDGLGFVEDVAGEVASWSASIVPINVGGGTRIKIAEAFSRKCPVVSTRLGAYGYQLESGVECLLADNPGELADACLRLMDDPGFGERLAERAWQRFAAEWSWDAIGPKVHGAVDCCMARAAKSIPSADSPVRAP